MKLPNLADALSPRSPSLTAPAQKLPEFERFEGQTLKRALSENRSDMDRVHAALDCTRMVLSIHHDRNRKAYAMAEAMGLIKVNEYFKDVVIEDLGRTCKTLSEYVDHICPFRRSTAFRYAKVGEFLDRLNVMTTDFENLFYEEHGIERKVVFDREGEVDELATREANRLVSRILYMDMSAISALSDPENPKITAAQARELMAQSILLDEDEFKKALREAKGEINPLTEEEKLFDAGFEAAGLVVPFKSGSTKDELLADLNLLVASIQAGMMDESLQEVQKKQLRAVASKATRYIVKDGFRYISL